MTVAVPILSGSLHGHLRCHLLKVDQFHGAIFEPFVWRNEIREVHFSLDCSLLMDSFEVEVIEFLFVVFRVVFVRSVPMARTHRCTRVDNYQ